MEQIFWSQQSSRQSFRVVTLEESGQYAAVRLQSVGPEILAHHEARRAQLVLHKGQCPLGSGRVAQLRKRASRVTFERLEDRDRQPRMLICEGTADPQRVHDRKQPGPPIPVGGRLVW